MKIALITPRFVPGDGQGRVNFEIAKAALDAGHDLWLVGREFAPELAAHERARLVRITVSRWPSELIRNQVFALKSAAWLLRARPSLDVVHVNGFVTWGRSDLNTAHFVHSAWLRSPYHTARFRRGAYGVYQLLYTLAGARLERWAYRRTARIVAVSKQVARELSLAGIDPRRLQVIGNGVDLEEFRPERVPRADLGLPLEGVLLLFVGEIRTPRKNLDTLLRALALTECMRLAVVGDTSGSPYPKLAAALGVAHRVSFLGYRKDVSRLMRAADIFVFPSRYEACSLVLLEAAASGLPIVAAKTTGGVELLPPESCVLLDDTEDESALARVLQDLAAQPSERARMGISARAAAQANSWRTMAERYLHAYAELNEPPVAGRISSLPVGTG